MGDILNPINAKEIVKDKIHQAEARKDIANWFKTETLEITFGDSTGRPSADITLQREYLVQFLQSGWSIDAVIEQGESGQWVSVGGSTSISKSQSFLPSYNGTHGNFSGLEQDLYGQTVGIGSLAYAIGREADPVNVSISKSSPSEDAPAFWTAYQKVRLKRRRLQAESVMQSLMDSFTKAYNDGRDIADARYNEIISLYTIMLQRNESEGNEIVSGSIDLLPLAQKLAESVKASVDEAEESTEEISDVAVKNREKDVNRQFDNLLAQTKAQMISSGMYNSTTWPSVAAGIERQRSEALDKAKEQGSTVKFNAKHQLATLKATVSGQILSAMQGIATAADQRKITVVELRNNVLKWMLDYIGTREEVYPELEEIATVAERMGFSVGSAGSTL